MINLWNRIQIPARRAGEGHMDDRSHLAILEGRRRFVFGLACRPSARRPMRTTQARILTSHGRPRTKQGMIGMMQYRIAVALSLALAMPHAVNAGEEPVIDPASPFRLGEGVAETPATCETLAHWIDRAPAYDGRITMAIKSPLEASHWDGTLAYLVMCKPSGVQVMCVTYAPHAVDPDVPVLIAGGYQRVAEDKVMLDPCLAFDE